GPHPRATRSRGHADRDFLAPLATQGEPGRAFLLGKCRLTGYPLLKEPLGAGQHLGAAQGRHRLVSHRSDRGQGMRRMAMPVGCAGTGTVATVFRVLRSNMSTAPGSAPMDSWLMK